MARVPISAAGRELYALWGRPFHSLTEGEWRQMQERWGAIFETEAPEPFPTADAYPLEHLVEDPTRATRFAGVNP